MALSLVKVRRDSRDCVTPTRLSCLRADRLVHPIEHDPAGRLCKHAEGGDAPVSVRLENQSTKVAGVELVVRSGIEDDRRLVALLERQSSLFCRQRVGRVELVRVVPAGEPG